MPKIQNIGAWLTSAVSQTINGRYRHQILTESLPQRDALIDGLVRYVKAAHDDALRRLRHLAGISLDPFAPTPKGDPGDLYPHRLHLTVLQGAFGEIFAGIVAEHFAPFGEDGWEVPAYLFRTHSVAFEQLEASFQTGNPPKQVPGRTGDDCLAFQRDASRQIVKTLYCEAKCTIDHNASMIAEAHEKVSSSPVVNLLQIVEILEDRGDPTSLAWIEPLRQLRIQNAPAGHERCDLVSYICGRLPRRNATWIGTEQPHEAYKANRRLEVVEVHLHDVESMVRTVYDKARWE
jgi:hypothetical protein